MKFNNVIICEDIRQEVGNKLTLVGVYSGDIFVSEMPANIWLAMYLDFFKEESNDVSFELQLLVNGDQKLKMHGSLALDLPHQSAVIGVPKFQLRFERDSEISIKAAFDGKRLRTLLSKEVRLGPVTA